MIIKKRVPIKYIFKELKVPLITVIILGLMVDSLPIIVDPKLLPKIPIAIASTLGIAISILLSFKLSQSYERWWEARKVWGAIVNDSRTLVLQLQMYLDSDNHLIKKIAYRQIAWCYSLGRALRKQDPLEGLSDLLTEEELKELESHKNMPLKILALQVESVKKLSDSDQLDNFSRLQIEKNLGRLTASMGKCERIKNTTFPPNYRRGLNIAIYLYVIFLSVSEPLKLEIYFEVPILIITSMLFFFLQKAAFRLQDPFENRHNDTAVTSISRTIDINIRQLLGEKEIPSPTEPNDFYVL